LNAISFELVGRFAHFRKYYTNTSSLTYDFPPRTTVIGLLAGILGRKRDSYYEEFSLENTLTAILLKSSNRKLIQTVKNIHTGEKFGIGNLISGDRNPSLTQMQLIVPELGEIRYKIYFHHTDEETLSELYHRMNDKRYCYPPFMGSAQFMADIENPKRLKMRKSSEKKIEIHSVCPETVIRGLEFDLKNSIFRDIQPISFSWSDGKRHPMYRNMIYSKFRHTLKFSPKYYYTTDRDNIVFLEK